MGLDNWYNEFNHEMWNELGLKTSQNEEKLGKFEIWVWTQGSVSSITHLEMTFSQ